MKKTTNYQTYLQNWQQQSGSHIDRYCSGACDFISGLLPEVAVNMPVSETLEILRRRFGDDLDKAIGKETTAIENPVSSLPEILQGPERNSKNGSWLKRVNMVGINVRTIGSFWNVVAYTLTLPRQQSSIHLLPIWEPGVVGSLYGMSSWQINRDFFCPELTAEIPHLATVEQQLRAVVNILHLDNRTIGMDVIPHTDRFSEMVLANPSYFEWLRRKDIEIVDHRADLHLTVSEHIYEFLSSNGSADNSLSLPESVEELFSDNTDELLRLRMLFGSPEDLTGRRQRRISLIAYLHSYGFEPVPMTMGPPYRGLEVDDSPQARKVDENGLEWRDYRLTKPTAMSRVFGPLARYKLYERLDDNRNWEIDFSRPRTTVWQYVCEQYAAAQQRFGFDFMRGDMSHVQMRPVGVPAQIPEYYDLLKSVQHYIREENNVPYFGYFAESFLAPPDTIAYGDEVEHLEASDAQSTLGDLQSMQVGSAEFCRNFRFYTDILQTRSIAPNFTMMTADKDDPRFDKYYLAGNELRHFIGLCLPDMPSYMGMGFEVRDVHTKPAPNEHYSKLFVFQEKEGPKATHGPFVWGKNIRLFQNLSRLNNFLPVIWPELQNATTRWIIPPDLADYYTEIAWTALVEEPEYLFLANLNTEIQVSSMVIPMKNLKGATGFTLKFSTAGSDLNGRGTGNIITDKNRFVLDRISPGTGQIYRIHRGD